MVTNSEKLEARNKSDPPIGSDLLLFHLYKPFSRQAKWLNCLELLRSQLLTKFKHTVYTTAIY